MSIAETRRVSVVGAGSGPTAFFASFTGAYFAAAFFAAQRFFKAATIAALPAAESFRFGFADFDVAGDVPLIAAHLARCAIAIFRRAAGENFFRLPVGASVVAVALAGPPSSMTRRSAIWASSRAFWTWKPSMAAVRISVLSFVGMWVSILFVVQFNAFFTTKSAFAAFWLESEVEENPGRSRIESIGPGRPFGYGTLKWQRHASASKHMTLRIARICEHLERDLASELHVTGTIDLSHAALPDGRKNFVGAQ
jgi:hypothetical protein